MGGTIVKLIGLTIKELYGCYDYDVTFNSDVTFLYGTNGCGKTTVLNITEAIITGQLFKLFDYKFTQIELKYAQRSNPDLIKFISIKNSKTGIIIIFNGEKHEIERLNINEEASRSLERNSRETIRFYFSKYEFLDKIKNTFNYVYLPLNRSSFLYDYDDEYYIMRRYRGRNSFESENYIGLETKDIAMMQIETLISVNYSRINSMISKFSDDFRNDILKSLLEVNRKYKVEDLLNELVQTRNSVSNLKETQSAYMKILKELSIISKVEEENYNNFFIDFIKEFEKFQEKNFKGFPLDLLMKFQEISKINNLVTIAKKIELKKAQARKPIEIFLNTMNDFINNSDDEKEIKIDTMGRVYFTTKYSKTPISIQHLSSGEKQLVTFFANLIFSVKNNTAGIFVVDEPELSLHLSWQKIFVEKTLEINKNIQLIFATHSPEIIGKNRNKTFRLEKKYVKAGEKDYD